MLIRNAWYVAAEPQELDSGPVARKILGTPLVLFKTASGALRAFEDRCPHRLAPLSLGTVVGENLRCAYHGAEFGGDGRCVKVPGQVAVAGAAAVSAFPILQRHGYLWVWLGDPARAADESTIPSGFAIADDTTLLGSYGRFESLKSDYRLLNDNLFDITHAEFVHPESFGGSEVHFYRKARAGSDYVDGAMTYDLQGESIHFKTHVGTMSSEGGPFWHTMLAHSRGLSRWEAPIDYKMEVSWWAPSCWLFHVIVRPTDQPDSRPAEIFNLHAAVPESEFSTHYFYRSLRNYGDESMNAGYADAARFVFGQDKRILEGQQEVIGAADLFDQSPVSFPGDRLQVEGRKILKKLALR